MSKESHLTFFCDVVEIKLICLQRLDVVVPSLPMNMFDDLAFAEGDRKRGGNKSNHDINCLSKLQKTPEKQQKAICFSSCYCLII